MLEFFDDYQLEVMNHNKWRVAEILSDHELAVEGVALPLLDGMELRFKKKLTLSLGTLLEDISDEAFLHFLTTLNSLNYSIFDCIYCHNHLTFLEGRKIKQGVNFIIFDNGDEICNVQHHFSYYQRHRDRFEFTNSTGKRIIIEKIE
ncbi:DUF2777 family protein [Bacillus coahuilensis]|nr:DUF2777 family protein [Bacillus coahuilensis]